MIKDLEQRFASAMKKGERFEKQQAKISKEREDIAKASKGKTFMGRPIHELDREQGIVRKKKSPISKVLKKETGGKKYSKEENASYSMYKRLSNPKHKIADKDTFLKAERNYNES